MRFILLMTAILLTACASSGKKASKSAAPQNALPPQTLAAGECGFFAWSAEATPRLIFFAKIDAAESWGDGLFQSASGPQDLRLQENEAGVLSFAREDGPDITLELGRSEEFERGTRYPKARLRTQTADGWDKLIPMAGLSTCQGAL